MIETVTILGKQHVVTMPNFAARESIVQAAFEYGPTGDQRFLRVYGAAIGLCTGLGRLAKADFARSKYDILTYGGDVYSWLREQGATGTQIVEQGLPLVRAIAQATFPREEEVTDAVGFTDEAPAPSSS